MQKCDSLGIQRACLLRRELNEDFPTMKMNESDRIWFVMYFNDKDLIF